MHKSAQKLTYSVESKRNDNMVGEKWSIERDYQNSNVKFMRPVLQPVVRKN